MNGSIAETPHPLIIEANHYRRKHFAVEVIRSRYATLGDEAVVSLSVSPNGSQWSTIALPPDEARLVIQSLQDYLSNGKPVLSKLPTSVPVYPLRCPLPTPSP